MEKSRSFLIDSSVIIAFYDDNDSQHEKALDVADMIGDAQIILHPYILQESASVLTYKFGPFGSKKFLDNIMNADNVVIDNVDTTEDIKFFLNLNKKVSFADATLIKIAKQKNATLLTFDKQIISILRNLK